jgi:hypothetical protein
MRCRSKSIMLTMTNCCSCVNRDQILSVFSDKFVNFEVLFHKKYVKKNKRMSDQSIGN